MKKLLLLLCCIAGLSSVSTAAVGDTTWVQAHKDVWLTYNGNFDSTVTFPDGTTSYRKVYMIFTLGKYACPGNPQYCSDWDYTVHTQLMTPNGDTMELGRLITPYANSSYIRFPMTWKEHYVYDVTDYYTLLKNSATIRIGYSGYSGGFTADVKFAFIEGTPTRNVQGIDRLWHGYFAFGKASDPIEKHVDTMSKTAPAGTVSADLKMNITGHGSDGTYCSEFCKKYYQVMLNGTQIAKQDIWRDDCGINHLYPQSGTWIYDRANWCPGDLVHANFHTLTGITAGSNYKIDVDFETYNDNGSAGYDVEGAVIYHGGFNHATDADLTDIVSPSSHEMHFRENPTNNKPIIMVKNNGSNPITSLKIEYTVNSSDPIPYNWTGSIAPLQEATITLPEEFKLRTATGANNIFTAKIAAVNGSADEDASNNALTSYFTAAPQWPMTLVVTLSTNKALLGGFAENNWKIVDALDNVIFERRDNAASQTYIDTVKMGPGSYRFIVEDHSCDGINFWANNPPANPSGPGPGSIKVNSTLSIIPLQMAGYFNGDFGCGFTQAFNVVWPTTVENVNATDLGMSIYPNPAASNTITVAFAGLAKVKGVVKIIDALGRTVIQQNCDTYSMQLNTAQLTNGVYQVMYMGENGAEKLQSRLVISK